MLRTSVYSVPESFPDSVGIDSFLGLQKEAEMIIDALESFFNSCLEGDDAENFKDEEIFFLTDGTSNIMFPFRLDGDRLKFHRNESSLKIVREIALLNYLKGK